MASIRAYVNGAGGSLGADLAVLKPVYTSGVYWYVGSSDAGASDANAGTERGKPLLTLAQAYANASAGDTIDLLSGHAETIGTNIVVAKAGLSIVGEGIGSSAPRLTAGSAITLEVTAAYVTLDNIYFPASTFAAAVRVQTEAAGISMNALIFECGANDTNETINVSTGSSAIRLTNSRFTSVATGASVAIECANNMAGLTLDNVTIDGGSFGWAAYAWRMDATITSIRATNINILNGSNVIVGTGCTGTIQVGTATSDSEVNWTP